MGRQPGEHGKQRSGEKAKGGMTMESLHRLQILITKEQYRWLKANSYTKAKSMTYNRYLLQCYFGRQRIENVFAIEREAKKLYG